MVGRPAPLSARERGSSPAVGPTSILCTLDPLVLRSVSPLKIGGPGLWEAPQGLPDWVPPSLRELVFCSRRRGSALSVGHFSPFPSEARCRPIGSRRPVVEVRTEARGSICRAALRSSRINGTRVCQGIPSPDTCLAGFRDPSGCDRRLVLRRCWSRAGAPRSKLEAGAGIRRALPGATSGLGLRLQGRGWGRRWTVAPEARLRRSRRSRALEPAG
ncbi:hypothetical protein NDU88_001572 [Pleurodeles waltl]|uniref:Uncharacterized protein n=1 Tax=Pleurodeles waltl TaxID=8319 RepID=A0AAV7ND00_PLEWA|nr:hypothetical protein NDU88_001572 [Pleurodeles waltl]